MKDFLYFLIVYGAGLTLLLGVWLGTYFLAWRREQQAEEELARERARHNDKE